MQGIFKNLLNKDEQENPFSNLIYETELTERLASENIAAVAGILTVAIKK